MAVDEHSLGGRQLAEWITSCILDDYHRFFGTFDQIQQALEVSRADLASLQAGEHRLPTLGMRRLCSFAMFQIWTEVNRARGRKPLRASHWRILLYGLSGARTMREAILRSIDCFDAIDGRMGKLELRVNHGMAELEIDSEIVPPTLTSSLGMLLGIAELHGLLEWLIARPLPLNQIYLQGTPELFGTRGPPPLTLPAQYGASWHGFAFPAAFLDYPVERIGDAIMERQAYSFLFKARDSEVVSDTPERVRGMAIRALKAEQRLPSFEDIAREAGLSPATLRRRLKDQGTSYRQIKESCRREMGLKMLRYSTLSIEDIATRLDYCDSDAFRRAFRSWMGMSPSKLRGETLPKREGQYN